MRLHSQLGQKNLLLYSRNVCLWLSCVIGRFAFTVWSTFLSSSVLCCVLWSFAGVTKRESAGGQTCSTGSTPVVGIISI